MCLWKLKTEITRKVRFLRRQNIWMIYSTLKSVFPSCRWNCSHNGWKSVMHQWCATIPWTIGRLLVEWQAAGKAPAFLPFFKASGLLCQWAFNDAFPLRFHRSTTQGELQWYDSFFVWSFCLTERNWMKSILVVTVQLLVVVHVHLDNCSLTQRQCLQFPPRGCSENYFDNNSRNGV